MKITYLFLILLSLLSISLQQDREKRNKCDNKYDLCKSLCKFKKKQSKNCLPDCYHEYKKCLE